MEVQNNLQEKKPAYMSSSSPLCSAQGTGESGGPWGGVVLVTMTVIMIAEAGGGSIHLGDPL